MNSITCAALLFDLDGVLVDSTPAVARVWSLWAGHHGFDAEEVVAHAHGRPSISTIRDYLPDGDHEAENREVERMEIADLDGVVPLPGALELLTSLPRDRWAIVTSCTRDLARVRIRAAGLPVPPVVITWDDVTHGKPNPEPFLTGAAKLGFPATECIVLEDAPAGIRAGKAAGARVLALTTTAPRSQLKEAQADWIVKNCADVRLQENGARLRLELNSADARVD
jgi:mannitol-1-/sugar-/sorbitol-6-phosphatase